MKKLLYTFIFVFSSYFLLGQVSLKDSSIFVPMFYGFYGYQLPGGDLVDQYGGFSVVGPGFQFKLKSNWIIGVEYNHYWGAKVKNDAQILDNFLTKDGNIIAMDGTYASFYMKGRGFRINANFGKLFPILSPNPNSGFIVTVGAGYLQHWNRIRVNEEKIVPGFEGDYGLGYDRLTTGFSINQFVGYLFLGNTRILNFYIGWEFMQAWTKNQRDIDFDTGKKDAASKFETLQGFKVGWIIPIHKRTPKEFYFY
ncbi:hypothetical protein ACFLRY_00875 [Bacteroidota bacterium]